MTYHKVIHSAIFIGLVSLVSCKSVKEVKFRVPVDTTSKEVTFQVKQTYKLQYAGVYASNNFDAARLNGFVQKNDSTAILIINPENTPINNSPYYAFKTWSETPKDFYFTFQYPEGYKHRYIPKLKIKNEWQVIDSSNIFRRDSIVTIKLELTEQPLLVAAQEIQSSIDVKNWYSSIIKGKENFIHLGSIGKSAQGKNLPVLDIYHGSKKDKPIIVLLTRQHPPEVTGYLAFQYFLETILDDAELSQVFLSRYRVLAFPIMNPDGVDLGHWRHNSRGVDLNRDWSVYNQPEIRQTVQFIDKTLKNNKSKLLLGLDFHSTRFDIFYTNKKVKGTTTPNFKHDWFVSLEKNIPDYKVNEKSSNSTTPVSKGWFLYGHHATGITYEIGDATSKEKIKLIASVSAKQMMNILLK